MILGKRCPNSECKHLVYIQTGQKDGNCDRCGKFFIVKYHLTKIRLIQEFIPRNYEAEILTYLNKKGRTYAGEISSHIGASKGVVSASLHRLEGKGLIIVTPRGKTKWITLPEDEV
jgi:Bacterial regulatory protein, arsR family